MKRRADTHHGGLPRWAWGLVLAGATLCFVLLLQVGASPTARYLSQLEHKALDVLFLLRADLAPTQPDERIVIVIIDDNGLALFEHRSLLAEGDAELDGGGPADLPWPWPRAFHGLVADYLRQAGARAVFFDFLFTGHSKDENLVGGDDAAFAEMCAAAGNVYQTLSFRDPEGGPEAEQERASRDLNAHVRELLLARFLPQRLARSQVEVGAPEQRSYGSVEVPLPELADAAKGLGAVNAETDPDGIMRRVRLVYGFRGASYPSIQLALARDLLGVDELRLSETGSELLLGPRAIPIDRQGRMLVSWHGGAKSYRYVPYHTLLLNTEAFLAGREPQLDASLFTDKIVLVGTSATGLADLKANPFGGAYPGVEVHATALDNILNGDFLHRPRAGTRLALTALWLLVAGQLLARSRGAAVAALIAAALVLAHLGSGLWLFLAHDTWLDQVVPTIALVLLFSGAQTVHYFTEGRQKRAIRGAFQRYLPPAVVDEVLKVPLEELKLGGDRRELTVFFSDIRGFTGISESLEPEELVRMLNVYLGEMTGIISRHLGTLDKYIGDSIMAFWGAPLPIENGAARACLAALENQERLAELRERFVREGRPPLHARIGINTGTMLVGNMGSEQHFSYTVMGDAVNLASRLEGASNQYGTSILIGAETYERARDAIEAREIDLLRVKGKREPRRVYELLARRGQLRENMRRVREEFVCGLDLYRMRDWSAARVRFEQALEVLPDDGPALVYRERCLAYEALPPPDDWDGVFEMRTK